MGSVSSASFWKCAGIFALVGAVIGAGLSMVFDHPTNIDSHIICAVIVACMFGVLGMLVAVALAQRKTREHLKERYLALSGGWPGLELAGKVGHILVTRGDWDLRIIEAEMNHAATHTHGSGHDRRVSMKRRMTWVLCLLLTAACLAGAARGDDIERDIQTIGRTGPQGVGAAEARAARDRLAAAGVDILPAILGAMNTSNVVAANSYRTVFEEIVAAELAKPGPNLPLPLLRDYVRSPEQRGQPRRLVLRLLDRIEPWFRSELVPTLLDDREFRTDAIRAVLAAGDRAKDAGQARLAESQYQKAFAHARDSGQVTQAADRLAALGMDVSIVEQMGLVTDWYLIGPFDAPGTSGFERVYPPQRSVDLAAGYEGKNGKRVRWKRHETADRLGQTNLNRAIAPVKEAVGYAYTEVNSPRGHDAQLRGGADDNLTVWLNGDKIFARPQWLNGTRFDRFTAPARLNKGTNRVLVKICQGPQHKDPAVPNNWSFQLRFCDPTGASVGLRSALAP